MRLPGEGPNSDRRPFFAYEKAEYSKTQNDEQQRGRFGDQPADSGDLRRCEGGRPAGSPRTPIDTNAISKNSKCARAGELKVETRVAGAGIGKQERLPLLSHHGNTI